jgi:polyisoprenoid-binding protein YceI
MYKYILPLLAAFVFLSGSAQAESQALKLDKPHTQILFNISHMGFSTSTGKFLDYDGTINFDKLEPEKSNVDVTIQTSSVDLGDQKWNDHMKAADFFNVEKFPTMTFKSTSVEVTGEKTANITGDLTILGVTKPVVLATTFVNEGKHPMSAKQGAGFNATTKIKRSDFGMGYGLPMIGDEVDITISAEAWEETMDANETTNN